MGAASTEIEVPRARPHHASGHHQRAARARPPEAQARCWWSKTRPSCCARSGNWRGRKWRSGWRTRSRIRSLPLPSRAERIGRHLDRGQPDSPNVIRKCSEVILGCVGTLRTLVDQFSALAQFPAPQPRACDMNHVVEEALALFAGRLEGITVQRKPGAGFAAGAGRSRCHSPRAGQPHRQRRRSHAGQPAARARSAHRAQRGRRRRRGHGLRHRPRVDRRDSRAACFCPSTPPSIAAPVWAFLSPPRSCRSMAAQSAPRPTAPRARAFCCACP